ncbi:GTP 3',8-cyclase MoaA [Campylobacter sp. LH-2024]|uniref:GTP 3',8-cyclase MoaA n=1 Tax=Campylobacter molothri TaxID=1032242 RepID=A0ACC5W238_9BACT|nr:GTP 3',8-cyclase MoaA [Campylobacter sp. RM10542]MBZ7931411.1 GTP 3',8-cyclase MoaA [Campylobacter sp. RM12910]MBZ7940913.1 GTP 3',8-cyclase MoaA [Campylobacter sp. W0047]MBZ7945370.1 GTP 3',8-cyclase MoaA [Campylobacter sp. RM10532]MBZ7946544.1 GTP 3',8-cyclase MoaA [Campylobacter sp. RM10536]MBZ7948255.1 GTP 3',8-cyclase MoaA [Campylobacter sp. RM9929]MBZ7951483.1 GTP 3',8-cyclase MoaA [Campylobacter sp. W0046]MBZ7955467.1 GTP 3',8-cyclase MoaA [Campylobacter sp. RM17709]MBZ7957106.1 G
MLIDQFGRKINYLRISVTQRCNFRCLYCMPKIPFNHQPKENLLSFEELFLFVKAAIDEGIEKIRITGGEPLLRKDLSIFIKMIHDYKKELDLAITTNGFLLKDFAKDLKNAGLKRLNVSLDTLDEKKAKKLAQKDVLSSVLAGIEEALNVGLKVKLNTVALKNLNDNELIALLEFAKSKNMQIRFIEFMENTHAYGKLQGLKRDEIIQILSQKYDIKLIKKAEKAPVSLYSANGYEFGIIDPHSHEFCDSCNRIRLSAEGHLIPCLYFDEALSIKEAIKKGDVKAAVEILQEVLRNKPEKNKWSVVDNETSMRAFYQTGG